MHKSVLKGNTERNLLYYVPEKKHMDFKTKEGKVLLIFKHKGPVERVLQWLFRKPLITDIELDSIGSRAWFCMDGHNTLYDIGRILEEEFGDQCRPVYKRLAVFIRYMAAQGWITLKNI